jgi:hypothetical protein
MKLIPVLLCALLLTPIFAIDTADAKASALALALTSSNWSWENTDGGTRSYEEIQFFQGGLAQNSKYFSAHWETVGGRFVVLKNLNAGTPQAGKLAHLVFDAAFTHFIGIDFNGKTTVEGFRREALDPNRPAPETKQPDAK